MVDYQKVSDFAVESGKRLLSRTGDIPDIGIAKKDLTEEDLRIERGFKEIIESFGKEHVLYAEEENGVFQSSNNLWVVDPISGTSNFIKGLPHYAVVVSHLVNHRIVFGLVYNPSTDELFTAQLGKGSFLNGLPIKVSETKSNVILRIWSEFEGKEFAQNVEDQLALYTIERNEHSVALNYCAVACGRFDGVVCMTKDSFPEFAGSLIVREAGGNFTNPEGESDALEKDTVFVAGNDKTWASLLGIVQNAQQNRIARPHRSFRQ